MPITHRYPRSVGGAHASLPPRPPSASGTPPISGAFLAPALTPVVPTACFPNTPSFSSSSLGAELASHLSPGHGVTILPEHQPV